jgi:glycosyltransferase involved in cell wall biosynthesis|tara:strand:+ start:405 stop:1130 length:726 start_codon:yes stop_codon:yes gene_type:complete
MNKKTVTLFVVALNEIDGLKAIMPRIDKNWVDQILIVDGDSRDGTVEYAKENGYEVVVQKRKGIRWAYNEAFPHVRGDYVITFSPDGNCPPEFIPELIKKITRENWDLVVAARHMPPATSADDTIITAFGNKMFSRLCSILHGYDYHDCMGMFRIYKTKLFYDLGLDKDEAYWMEKYCFTIMGVEPLLSARAAKMKLKITEIPCDEPKRISGIRKLQLFRWGSAYLVQMIFEAFTNKYRAT